MKRKDSGPSKSGIGRREGGKFLTTPVMLLGFIFAVIRLPHPLFRLVVYRPIEVYVRLFVAPVADQDCGIGEGPFIVTRRHIMAVLAGVLDAQLHSACDRSVVLWLIMLFYPSVAVPFLDRILRRFGPLKSCCIASVICEFGGSSPALAFCSISASKSTIVSSPIR